MELLLIDSLQNAIILIFLLSYTFTDLRNLMQNFSTFSLAVYLILLSVRKISYISEQ